MAEWKELQLLENKYTDAEAVSAINAKEIWGLENIFRLTCSDGNPFTGVINGNPSSTSVVYDGEAHELFFHTLVSGKNAKVVLHNTTRGNTRIIDAVNRGTNTITTVSSTDNWADNDVITCRSQTNTNNYAGYHWIDLDFSTGYAANVSAIWIDIYTKEEGGNATDALRSVILHPYEAYNGDKRVLTNFPLANSIEDHLTRMELTSQKITVMLRGIDAQALIMFTRTGYKTT